VARGEAFCRQPHFGSPDRNNAWAARRRRGGAALFYMRGLNVATGAMPTFA
jgi:hypothetical protein